LLEKLTKPAQVTELQIAVAVALRERMKTIQVVICSQEGQPIRAKVGHIEHRLDYNIVLLSATNFIPSSGDLR